MKKVILIIVFFISQKQLFSQTNVYYPFPDSNAVWLQEHCDIPTGCYVSDYMYEIYISKDTVLSGLLFKKLDAHVHVSVYYTNNPPQCIAPSSGYYNIHYGYFRNDTLTKRVYVYTPTMYYPDSVLYDFSKNVGDTVSSISHYPPIRWYIIDTLDSIKIGNNYRKMQRTHNNYGDRGTYIEGIGSNFGIYPFGNNTFESCDELICFSQNNQKLYPDTSGVCQHINSVPIYARDKIKIFPNPANDKIFIEGISKNSTIKISTILGEILMEAQLQTDNLDVNNLKEGIYFLDIISEPGIVERKKIIISR